MTIMYVFVAIWVTPSVLPAGVTCSPVPVELTVAQPSGMNRTLRVTVEEDQLLSKGVSAKDLQETLIYADKDGKVSEAVVKGKHLPFRMDLKYEVEKIFSLRTEGNQDWIVTRENYSSVTLEDFRDDTSLRPDEVPSLLWTPLSLSPPPNARSNVTLTSSHKHTSVAFDRENLISFTTDHAFISSDSLSFPQGSGCYLFVLNPYTRRVTLQLHFDTSEYLIDRELVQTLRNLRRGRVALLTTLYDASGRLELATRAALKSLGSWAAPHIKFRDCWLWAWHVGGATMGEALVTTPIRTLGVPSPLHLDLEIDLDNSNNDRFCPNWPHNDLWKKRHYFCDLYDGYGDLCSCDDPFLQQGAAPPRMNTWREPLAVVVIAGSRPRYLYRLLKQLLTQPGLTSDLVLVSVDGEDEEVIRLLQVLDLKFLLHQTEGRLSSTRISRHLRFALFKALEAFPNLGMFIVLEEDLLLAPDFYSYMQQTSQLLKEDPTLYAVSAYNIFSAPHTSRDLTRLSRVTSLPACGWMVPRTFLEEILPMWPPSFIRTAWDYWFWTDLVRAGREIVIPEVPRTAHGGRYGTHSSGHMAMERDALKPISTDPNARVNLTRMKEDVYEEELMKEISRAVALDTSDPRDLPHRLSHLQNGTVALLAVEMKGIQDESAFRILAQALRIWHQDHRDQHHGLWRFPYYDAVVLIIGVPYSRYSKHFNRREWILRPRPTLELEVEEEEMNLDEMTLQLHEEGDFEVLMG